MQFGRLISHAARTGSLFLIMSSAMAYSLQDGPPPPDGGPPPFAETTVQANKQDVEKVLKQMSKRYKLSTDQKMQLRPILMDEWTRITAFEQSSSLSTTEKKRKIKTVHQEASTRIGEILTKEQFEKFELDQAKIQSTSQNSDSQDGPPGPPPGGGGPGGGPPPM